MTRERVVDRGVIQYLVMRRDLHKEFPALTQKPPNRGKRMCCGRREGRTQDVRHVKTYLMGLTGPKLKRLKEVLNADTLVFYSPGAGKLQKITR